MIQIRAIILIILVNTFVGNGSVLKSKEDLIHERIVGGNEADVNKFLYQSSIRYKYPNCPSCLFRHICSGIIYSTRIVLTAAQCVRDDDIGNYLVVVGTKNRDGGDGTPMRVEQILLHDKYNSFDLDNDIAVFIMGNEIPLNGYSIAAIQLGYQNPQVGTLATISGWGRSAENGVVSATLQELTVAIVSETECNAAYDNTITKNMLCAGHLESGQGICEGDFGGPLVVDKKLIGIASWSRGCARDNYPGVYTNILQFHEWIENISQKILL